MFVSGLLTEKVGGPSVQPYQPAGLWKEIASTTDYNQSTGPDLYRRSLYTYWKRTVAPPSMLTLDATAREACVVRRSRTNTPLQALALMNDVTFVEAARNLADRRAGVLAVHAQERLEYLRVTEHARPQEAGGLQSDVFARVVAQRFDHEPVSYTHLTLPTTPYV